MYQKKMSKIRDYWRLTVFFFLSLMMNGCVSSELDSGIDVDMDNCTLTPVTPKMQFKLDKLIEGNNRLIYLDISVLWISPPPGGIYPVQMTWMFTIDDSGRHLLLLDDNFKDMSLKTLSGGIVDMPLRLTQQPEDCLANMTATSAEKHLKFALLNLPTKSKEDEENTVSPFYICTGSVHSNGECCNITYSGDNVKCYKLKAINNLIDIFSWIMASLTCMAWAHCIYLITKSVYEEDKKSYKVDTEFRLKLKVVKAQVPVMKEWSKLNPNDPLSSDIIEQIRTLLKSPKVTDESNDTNTSKTCNLIVKLESINVKNSALVSELNAGLFKYLLKTINCKAVLIVFFIILFCLLGLRIYAGFTFTDFTLSGIILYVASVVVILCLVILYYFLKPHYQPTDNNIFINSFQIIDKVNEWERAKCYPYFLLTSLPLLHFTTILWKHANGRIRMVISLIVVFSMFDSLLGVKFYMKCSAYVVLGLVLNYELQADIALLILMILAYVYNCIQNVYQIIISFNQEVCEIVRKRTDSRYTKTVEEQENVAIELACRDKEQENKLVGLRRGDGNSIMCLTGSFIFYQYQKSERLSYMHLPKLFLDHVASLPGHLTPGPKYVLLFRACIEIIIMLVAAITIFIVVHSFGRVHDISATAHTLATVVTSAVFMKFNSLFFKAKENHINDHHTHLKTLIRRHLNEFKDTFEDIKIRIVNHDFIDTLDTDHDMAVFVCKDESGKEMFDFYSLKQFPQTKQYTNEEIRQALFGIQPENVRGNVRENAWRHMFDFIAFPRILQPFDWPVIRE